MSQNKEAVQSFLSAFAKADRERVLSCLTDDVEWLIPGAVHVAGKAAFIEQIDPSSISGEPIISVSRMTEERDVVVAEGSIRYVRKDGSVRETQFCDVFVMRHTKIKHLTAYLMELNAGTPR